MTLTMAPKEYSLVSLDLANDQAAIDLAEKIAARTGRAVTVRDVFGNVIVAIDPTAPSREGEPTRPETIRKVSKMN